MILKEYSFGRWEKSEISDKYVFIDNDEKVVYETTQLVQFNNGFVVPFDFNKTGKNSVEIVYNSTDNIQNAIIHYKEGVLLVQSVHYKDITLYDDDIIVINKNDFGIARLFDYDEETKTIRQLLVCDDIYYIDEHHFGCNIDGVHHLIKKSTIFDKRVINIIPYGTNPLSIQDGYLVTLLPSGEVVKITEI